MNNKVEQHIELSIQLSSDGFSFCTYNSQEKKHDSFVSINFSAPIYTPHLLLQEITNIFSQYEELHKPYGKVTLIHHNALQTFVPQFFFDEQLLPNYLENSVKIFENDFISYDEIPNIQANNVYVPFVNINNFIFDSFGTFTYLHSSTVFLENILKTCTTTSKQMFVNVYSTNFQLLVLEDKKLQLSNHFTFTSKEDFVYYILFVAEQLKMNTNEFKLTLFGNIHKESEPFKLLYNYVRNVTIYETLSTPEENIKVPKEHFNLSYLHA